MSIDIKLNIQEALQSFNGSSLFSNAIGLFNILGYNTTRQQQLNPADFKTFNTLFVKNNRNNFNEEKALISNWEQVQLLFQLTQAEMSNQSSMFDTGRVDNTIIEAYLFFAIELTGAEYTRTQLSDITREVNKVFSMPVMVLFKYGQHLTLSVIKRRLNKRDDSKDVLEKVTLIKDISINEPHRAHIEIFYDLSFQKLYTDFEFHSFIELHKAWQKTLDTEALNKRFYRELANWYFWSLDKVQFPDDTEKNKDIRNATNLIRLITRVVFIWFIKEKRLVPDSVFNERQISKLIKDFNKTPSSSNYYQAVLQNLFFGTLNQEIDKREFAVEGGTIKENKDHYGVKNIYRYADKWLINKEEVISFFENVPFLNGGLFDCLDKLDDNNKVIYVDGFTREPKKQAIVPDYLFFSGEQTIDLNDIYATKKKKYKVKGLIQILNNYKFTITENTPLEEEIALDPELLGKVFENLLASYNPETQTTARKLTGSFYTPRDIVDYMVSQSLKEYIKQAMDSKIADLETRLEDLFLYNEKPNPFTKEETAKLIQAIDACKILDPACGSGAFPMGMLHKLVHLLQKLDPDNTHWRELQKNKAINDTETAYKSNDKKEKERLLIEINDVFDNNTSDYGRKLYLIENCIYGIDIQPIAVQIAKLRFFISLVVDQTKENAKPNFGIRSLPNLETKFVAANTLIGLEKPKQQAIRNLAIDEKEEQLKEVRHKYFMAKKRNDKISYQKRDKELRKEIAALLKEDGWDTTTAEKIVEFDPYNQNASATWFEAEWMYGLEEGFDIAIGNPPYIKEYTSQNAFDGLRNSQYYQGKMDIWYFFAGKLLSILKPHTGLLTFIATNNWTTNSGASKFRNQVANDVKILQLIDFNDYKVFESAGIQTMIMVFKTDNTEKEYTFDYRKVTTNDLSIDDVAAVLNKKQSNKHLISEPVFNREYFKDKTFLFNTSKSDRVLNTILKASNFKLNGKEEIAQGIVTPQGEVNNSSLKMLGDDFELGQGIFNLTNQEKGSLKLTQDELNLIKPFYTTAELGRYYGRKENSLWVIYTNSSFKNPESITPYPNIKEHLDKFQSVITSDNKPYGLHRSRDEYFFKDEKIISLRKCGMPTFTYTNFDCYVSQTFYIIKSERINHKYLTSLLNSKLIAFWLKHKGKMQGSQYQIDKAPLLELPIIKPSNTIVFQKLVDYIILQKSLNADSSFFERLIDAMVYELYFPNEMKAANCEVLKHLDNLPELKEDGSNEQKLKTIEQGYKQLSDPHHPISSALLRMMNIEEIEIIEGRK